MLVNPGIVFDLLGRDRAIREFQIRIRKAIPGDADSMDEMVVRVEAEEAERERIGASLPERVREAVMIRPVLEFAAPGAIHDPMRDVKARRLVDERGAPAPV